ncbi:MAG: acylphosphatase, partial [Candidatus Eremiobacteraeota bacterium]|nr:acylphosphatase [Candidatus Eremiobacteraeota bacterium]
MERLRLIISGRVQNVFFRASTAEQAQRLRLTGWV